MRIALKYGLLITVGVIGWIVIAHWLVPNPQSAVHSLGAPVFFNFVEIVGIYCGINARRNASAGELSFKNGIKTGVGIAFVYAVSSCLFFLIEILVVGTKMLKGEQGAVVKPMWQVAVGAFAGLFIFAIFLGLIYSTLVSFILVRQRKV
jgi:Ca2+/H+ antiporter